MIEKFKKIILSPLVLALIVAIPTFVSLLRPGYFPMHDDISAMRLYELDKCVKDGQIPCRWVPDMGFGYGYPQFNYYAPLPYYIMEAFHLTGLGFLDSVKAGFIISFVLSAVGMYLLGKSLWGRAGGFISAVFYLYLPYRAVDAFVRGAVGELFAMALLPYVFWAARGVLMQRKRAILWFSLSLAALLMSHNITSVIFIPFLAAWVVFVIYSQRLSSLPDYKKRIFNLGLGGIWGFGLSAFFVLPAFFEKGLVHIETLTGGYFDYLAHFVSLGQLLFSSYWGYGVSEAGPWDEVMLGVGILHWSVAILAVLVAVILKARQKIPTILFWITAGFASLFMIHSRSSAIWRALPFASFVQFPWRFLLLSGFFFSAAAGSLALFLPKGKNKLILLSALTLVVIGFNAWNFRPSKWLDISDAQKFSGDSWQRQQTVSIFDYLPIYVQKGPTQVAPDKPQAIRGTVESLDWQKGTDWQAGTVRVFEKSQIELPIYYFPNWEVKVDGKKAELSHEGDLALIRFELEPGEHKLEAKLKNTPVRTFGNLISLLGLVLIPLYLRRK